MTSAAQLRDAALQWQASGREAMVVQVLSARGSVPRDAGTRMLVGADRVLGSIGGGHLELKAIERARHAMQDGLGVPDESVALGPSLGQCCGGALALRYTWLATARPAAWALPPPRFDLQLYGAGHVGRAIVRLLSDIDCSVRWVDEREDEFPTEPLPVHIEAVCAEPLLAEVAAAAPGAFHLVLTHSHDLDLALSLAILQRADFGFFGLIGSATKRARFEHRLREHGLPAGMLARMVCPIGLPGLQGKEPEVLAVSVVAQLLLQASPAAP